MSPECKDELHLRREYGGVGYVGFVCSFFDCACAFGPALVPGGGRRTKAGKTGTVSTVLTVDFTEWLGSGPHPKRPIYEGTRHRRRGAPGDVGLDRPFAFSLRGFLQDLCDACEGRRVFNRIFIGPCYGYERAIPRCGFGLCPVGSAEGMAGGTGATGVRAGSGGRKNRDLSPVFP